MFLEIEKKNSDKLAVIDDRGYQLTYGELISKVVKFMTVLENGSVAFVLCENCSSSLIGYISMIEQGVIPLLLRRDIDSDAFYNLLQTYQPRYIFLPRGIREQFSYPCVYEEGEYCLVKTEYKTYPINEHLQLLMTTSGSTGSPKLVRYKKGNLEVNARNVAKAFGWTEGERAICDLGMQYTMGLNNINTHLYVGATVLLTDFNLMESGFWDFIKEHKGTNFTGVPFSYDILHRLHYEKMDIDHIRTFSQGGGKLTDERFSEFAEYCSKTGRRFVASFGTTETSARMCMLAPELATIKIGGIGNAIPQGEVFLVDREGKKIEQAGEQGELWYKGPNVTMGYAENKLDLNKGDEWNGEYHTGDLAYRDEDDCYYITGRINRFLKLLGHRVSLDECERMISENYGIECACSGNDQKMLVYIENGAKRDDIVKILCDKTGLFKSVFEVRVVDSIPRSDRGKVDYKRMREE